MFAKTRCPIHIGWKRSGFGLSAWNSSIFIQTPPLLTTVDYDDINSREYLDTLTVPQGERWKLLFQCSMFGVRAIRLAT